MKYGKLLSKIKQMTGVDYVIQDIERGRYTAISLYHNIRNCKIVNTESEYEIIINVGEEPCTEAGFKRIRRSDLCGYPEDVHIGMDKNCIILEKDTIIKEDDIIDIFISLYVVSNFID